MVSTPKSLPEVRHTLVAPGFPEPSLLWSWPDNLPTMLAVGKDPEKYAAITIANPAKLTDTRPW